MPIPVEIHLEWRGARYDQVDRGLAAIAGKLGKTFDAYSPLARVIMRDYMKGVLSAVRARVSAPYPGGTSPSGVYPGTLSRRSGGLLASLQDNKIRLQGGVKADATVSFILTGIAAVHENGAVIKPRSARYLTVPLPAALDGRGIALRSSAREWKDTFIQQSKQGNLLIFQKRGPKIVPLYVLKKQVTIPKRLAFRDSFLAGRDFLADKMAEQMLREFQNG